MITLNKFLNVITFVLQKFLNIIMWVMVLSVVWQVFTRFVINSPSTFTDELSRYLMMWLGILGGAYVYALKRHLAIEILGDYIPKKFKVSLQVFIQFSVILFTSIVLIYGGCHVVSTTLSFNQVSPSLVLFGNNLPIGYVYMVAPLSGILIVIYSVGDVLSLLSNKEG